MSHMRNLQTSGFTLVEILVALFIFAIVGLMGTQLIGRVSAQQTILSERGARLIEMQRAMNIFKRDVMQIHSRGIRDEHGDVKPAVLLESDERIEFTRTGWRNPLGQPRSDLQRVAYQLDEPSHELRRYYWPVLDRAQDSAPVVQVLLTDVESVEFAIMDAAGNLQSYWPQTGAGAAGAGTGATALVLRVEAAPFGSLERIWEIPGG